jgi:hypothetical protein
MTPSNINALAVRRELNRPWAGWLRPIPHGPDGWRFDHETKMRSIIVTCAPLLDDNEWVHASMTGINDVPPYADLVVLHRAVFGDGWAYLPFAPPAEHVNICGNALHLFGRLDGKPALPDFTLGTGSI